MNWQSKETAPTDGTIILVAYYNSKYPNDFWPLAASFRVYHPNAMGKLEWRDRMGNRVNFSHWCEIQIPDESQKP